MATVIVKDNDLDGAFRVLRAKNAKDGSSKKIRERQEGFQKPGVRKRIAKMEGIKRTRKRMRGNRNGQ